MLTPNQQFDIISLVYHKWSNTHDNVKWAKQMEFDKAFHGDRESFVRMKELTVSEAVKEETKWSATLAEVKALWKDSIPKI